MSDKLAEITVNTFSAMGSAPANLAEYLEFIRKTKAPSEKIIIEDLFDPINKDDAGSPVYAAIAKNFRDWDYIESDEWTNGTTQNTGERRELIYKYLGLNKEQKNLLEQKIPFYTEYKAPTVIAIKHTPWYSSSRSESRKYYWEAYRNYLETSNNWKEKSWRALDDSTRRIVARLTDPAQTKAYRSKGLVVGYVQSGKTANFTGVIAKAADAGYRLIIVFSGTLDILREQTQRRIDKELIGQELLGDDYEHDPELDEFLSHGQKPSLKGAFDWQRLTGPQYDYQRLKKGIDALEFEKKNPSKPFYAADNLHAAKARLIILKKHPRIINKLIHDLKSLESDLGEVPALIIDDESDQASINTSRKKVENKKAKTRTATNRAIVELLEILPRGQYVGYTATPFANVFINPEDEEDIFPKDFILTLDRPIGYMGVSDFYDLAGEREGYLSNERAFIRAVKGEDGKPDNLMKAIDSFVLSGAIKLYRARKDKDLKYKHHTMLIHNSPRVNVHAELADQVRGLYEGAGYVGGGGKDRLKNLWDKDYKGVSKARGNEYPLPVKFGDLVPYIGECLANINRGSKSVLIVNGNNKDDSPNFEKESVWKILVGGTKLSRGYTVEGLTVSYYRRRTGAADTLMQMGRWFGFRYGYNDLVRLFIGRSEKVGKKTVDLYEAFEGTCLDEEAFRKELEKYSKEGLTPMQVPPLVPNYYLPPTSKNKMFNAEVTFKNFSEQWREPTLATQSKHHAADNIKLAEKLFSSGDIKRVNIKFHANDRDINYEAMVGILPTNAAAQFLRAYKWSDGNEELLYREIDYLENSEGDIALDQWILIAPQLVSAGEQITMAGEDYDVRRRKRSDVISGRFKVYSEPDHKITAEYLIGKISGKYATKAAKELKQLRSGVLVLYPVKDKRDGFVSIGFALQFPKNKIKKQISFTVRDKTRRGSVTVPV